MSSDCCDKHDDFFKGLIIGGLVGAGLLFFFGTEKGKKTQKLLRERTEELADTVGDKIGELEEEGKRIKKELDKKIAVAGKELVEKVDDGLDSAFDTGEEMIAKGEELIKKGREAKSNYFKKNGKPLVG